jgi:hypothetical protein
MTNDIKFQQPDSLKVAILRAIHSHPTHHLSPEVYSSLLALTVSVRCVSIGTEDIREGMEGVIADLKGKLEILANSEPVKH